MSGDGVSGASAAPDGDFERAVKLLRLLVAPSPWDSDFENGDWCHFCVAEQPDGHDPECAWVAAKQFLSSAPVGR